MKFFRKRINSVISFNGNVIAVVLGRMAKNFFRKNKKSSAVCVPFLPFWELYIVRGLITGDFMKFFRKRINSFNSFNGNVIAVVLGRMTKIFFRKNKKNSRRVSDFNTQN